MLRTLLFSVVAVLSLLQVIASGSNVLGATDDIRTWGGSGDDLAFFERDAAGNSYFVGFTDSFSPPGSKVLIVMFDATRRLQWSRAWVWDGGDIEVNWADVTPAGDVLIAGNTKVGVDAAEEDLIVARFDASGEFIWATTWDGDQPVDFDFADGVVATSTGAVFVGGGTRMVSTTRMLVARFADDGSLSWARTWQRNTEDSCNSVAVDSSDNLFCGGNSRDASSRLEALVVKFDANGGLDWARSWRNDTPLAFEDDAFGIAVDPAGNPVLVGGSDISGEPEHAMIVKFLADDGSLAWARIWGKTLEGGPGTTDGTGVIHIDDAGNIYTGESLETSEGKGDALLLKFTGGGQLVHAKAWGGEPDKSYLFSGFDASDTFEFFVGGVTSEATGTLRQVCRETTVPANSVMDVSSATVGFPGDGSSPTNFTEVTASGCASPPCGGLDLLLLRLSRVCIDVGTDPITTNLALAKGGCGAATVVAGRTVQVVRGELEQVTAVGGSVDLGLVECVGVETNGDRVEDLSDSPEPGTRGYYFLARIPALQADFGSAGNGGVLAEPRDVWMSDPLCSCP